ncbi:unnamed protein product [Pseudo-nitzschia multistriata]|uniref:Uncharacterized protein n=1 Tax=Pseudo-nitzschia multistriata TaxID=183589 RepID=A0A448Z9U1_9STRA|nr:unnamed protein product [Pseudo-nitzschia multistriata]
MKKPVTASKAKNAAEPTPVPSEKVVAEPTSPAKTSPVEKDATKPVRNPAAIAAPAPGVKHVRAAYKGKGWAPPQKEWESNKKTAGDKTRIEIEDEWDEDGNLKRTTTKYTTTPDWKKTTETTVEVFSAEEAKKMGLGRK